jgi:hypothetical protein
MVKTRMPILPLKYLHVRNRFWLMRKDDVTGTSPHLTIFFSDSFFSPTKSRWEACPLQLASRHTRARCPSRSSSCPKAVVLPDRVPCTQATLAGGRAHHIHVHSHDRRLSPSLALAIPDHHLRRSQRRRHHGDFEHSSGRGGWLACEEGRGMTT